MSNENQFSEFAEDPLPAAELPNYPSNLDGASLGSQNHSPNAISLNSETANSLPNIMPPDSGSSVSASNQVPQRLGPAFYSSYALPQYSGGLDSAPGNRPLPEFPLPPELEPIHYTEEDQPKSRKKIVVAIVSLLCLGLVLLSSYLGYIKFTQYPLPKDNQSSITNTPLAGTDSKLAKFVNQKISWYDCDGKLKGHNCADIEVPLDYQKPEAKTIKIHVLLVQAEKEKKGTIFVNPGGPGSGGTELATRFARKNLENFDIVGWDPRGTGKSEGLKCLDGPATDKYLAANAYPTSAAERKQIEEKEKAFATACGDKYPDLIDKISTLDTVQDLDLLRQIFGSKKLDYVGYSYGTYLGAVYASKYPDNIGHMVLDAPMNMDPGVRVLQAKGFDDSLHLFAKWCASKKCLGVNDATEVISKITGLWDQLRTKPLKVGDRELTQNLAVLGVALLLYLGEDGYSSLGMVLGKALSGDGTGLLKLADMMQDRAEDGTYEPGVFAFPAIRCLDETEGDVAKAWKDWEKAAKEAPIFGKYMGPDLICAVWPTKPKNFKFHKLAKEILLIAAKDDPATPYKGGLAAAKVLGGRLLTVEGAAHGSYGQVPCVDKYVTDYFNNDKLPPADTVCKR